MNTAEIDNVKQKLSKMIGEYDSLFDKLMQWSEEFTEVSQYPSSRSTLIQQLMAHYLGLCKRHLLGLHNSSQQIDNTAYQLYQSLTDHNSDTMVQLVNLINNQSQLLSVTDQQIMSVINIAHAAINQEMTYVQDKVVRHNNQYQDNIDTNNTTATDELKIIIEIEWEKISNISTSAIPILKKAIAWLDSGRYALAGTQPSQLQPIREIEEVAPHKYPLSDSHSINDNPEEEPRDMQPINITELTDEKISNLSQEEIKRISAKSMQSVSDGQLHSLGDRIIYLSPEAIRQIPIYTSPSPIQLQCIERSEYIEYITEAQSSEWFSEKHNATPQGSVRADTSSVFNQDYRNKKFEDSDEDSDEDSFEDSFEDSEEKVKNFKKELNKLLESEESYGVFIGMPGSGKTCMLDNIAMSFGADKEDTTRSTTKKYTFNQFSASTLIEDENLLKNEFIEDRPLIDLAGENFKDWYLKNFSPQKRENLLLDMFFTRKPQAIPMKDENGLSLHFDEPKIKDSIELTQKLLANATILYVCIPICFDKSQKPFKFSELTSMTDAARLIREKLNAPDVHIKFLYNRLDLLVYQNVNNLPYLTKFFYDKVGTVEDLTDKQVEELLKNEDQIDVDDYRQFYDDSFDDLLDTDVMALIRPNRENEGQDYLPLQSLELFRNTSFSFLLYHPHTLDRYHLYEKSSNSTNEEINSIKYEIRQTKAALKYPDYENRLFSLFQLNLLGGNAVIDKAKKWTLGITALVLFLSSIAYFFGFLTDYKLTNNNAIIAISSDGQTPNAFAGIQSSEASGANSLNLMTLNQHYASKYKKLIREQSYSPNYGDEAGQYNHTCHALFTYNSAEGTRSAEYQAFLTSFSDTNRSIRDNGLIQQLDSLLTVANNDNCSGSSGSIRQSTSEGAEGCEVQDCAYALVEQYWKPKLQLAGTPADRVTADQVNSLLNNMQFQNLGDARASLLSVAGIGNAIEQEQQLLNEWQNLLESTDMGSNNYQVIVLNPSKVDINNNTAYSGWIQLGGGNNYCSNNDLDEGIEKKLCDHLGIAISNHSNYAMASLTLDNITKPANLDSYCKANKTDCEKDLNRWFLPPFLLSIGMVILFCIVWFSIKWRNSVIRFFLGRTNWLLSKMGKNNAQ